MIRSIQVFLMASMPSVLPLTDAVVLAQPHPGSMRLTMDVPADAQVVINGNPTTSTGSRRVFASKLPPGKVYSFEVRVRIPHNGEYIEDVKTAHLRVGQNAHLVFSLAEALRSCRPQPTPHSPLPEQKPEPKVVSETSGHQPRAVLKHQFISFFEFSSDGRSLATETGYHIAIWDVASARLRGTIDASELYPVVFRFSPDGRFLAAWKGARSGLFGGYFGGVPANSSGKQVELWDVMSVERLSKIDHPGADGAIFLCDHTTLAVTGRVESHICLKLWDLATQEEHALPDDLTRLCRNPVFSANGSVMLAWIPSENVGSRGPTDRGASEQAADREAEVVAYDLGTGKRIPMADPFLPKIGRSHDAWDPVTTVDVKFSPDGKLLTYDGISTIRLVDVATGSVLHRFPHPAAESLLELIFWPQTHTDLYFSGDGKTLICVQFVGGSNGQSHFAIQLWDVVTGEQRAQLKSTPDGYSSFVGPLLEDGRTLVTRTTEGLSLSDVATGKKSVH